MGQTCSQCHTCDAQIEWALGDYFLEPYQNNSKAIHKLDKYDQFYRVVGDPFHRLQIDTFIDDLDELIFDCESKFEASNPGVRFNLEHIPYVKFINWYQKNQSYASWKQHIENVESPFMRLLQLDDLFFIRKLVEETPKPSGASTPQNQKQ